MKTILIIALIFAVNTSYAQVNKAVEPGTPDSINDEMNLFEKVFGKSNKTLELEKVEKSIHEKDINDLSTKIDVLKRSLEEHILKTNKSDLALERKIKNIDSKNKSLQKRIDSESKSLQKRIDEKNSIVMSELTIKLKKISTDYENNRNKINDNLISTNSRMQELEAIINSIIDDLGRSQKYSETLSEKISKNGQITSSNFDDFNKTLGKSNRYWAGSIILLVIIVFVLFLITKKIIKNNKSLSIDGIKETRRVLEEESIQLDNKLIKLIDAQIDMNSMNPSNNGAEKDHSLALKVADEIVRIQKNISRMDKNVKGIKQLSASVSRIQDNFSSNGYEIIEMLGKPYNEGMKVSANFIPDEEMDEGLEIITRIIKPQVNYKDVMIQSAQIEVSIGEK